MIRLIHCVKARDELSTIEFRRFFNNEAFAELMRELAAVTDAVDHKASLTLDIAVNMEMQENRGGAAPFDALIEVRWRNGQDLLQRVETEAFEDIIARMDEYQGQFVDFSRSSRFFVED